MHYKNGKYYSSIAVIILMFALGACNSKPDVCANAEELIEKVKPHINEVTTEDFIKNYLGSEKDYLLIDVRQGKEFEDGNIEGAVNLPRGIIEFKINDATFWEEQMMYPPADTSEILIYCKKGSRGALATAALNELGYKNVKNLTGGYTAFQEKHQDSEEE